MTTFTYNLLFATTSPDDVKEMGPIEKAAATQLFHAFPFQVELSKHRENPNLMMPTITFHNEVSGQDLAIWSELVGKYNIWQPDSMTPIEFVTDSQDVVKCIELFFDEHQEQLNTWLQTVVRRYGKRNATILGSN